jgi:hypothetical protein
VVSIFPGLVLLSGKKLILGLLATITHKVVHFRRYTLFPVLLQFFKCILEAFDSTSITSTVSKWRPFSFILSRRNRKVWWVGNDSHVFGKKNSRSERKSETARSRDTTASSFVAKVQGEIFSHFHAIAV